MADKPTYEELEQRIKELEQGHEKLKQAEKRLLQESSIHDVLLDNPLCVAINDHVAIYRHEDQIEFYTASGLIFSCSENDRYGFRLAQGILVKQAIATPAQLSKALGVNRTTVYRNLKKYEEGGPSALIIDKSNRSAYKLKDNKSHRVQELLNKGYSLRVAAKEVGVTEGCIRYAIKKGTIVREKQPINRRGSRKRRQSSVNNIIGQSGSTTKGITKKIYL